jgi:dTMP kinase
MLCNKGKLIVIEGIDGAGKATHTKFIVDWLQEELTKNVVTFDFPAYMKSPFGKIIGNFLNGEFGDPITMDPFETALLYAGDRYHAKRNICAALDRGDTIIINRYVPSNLAYGCAKLILLGRINERRNLEEYTEHLEYDLMGLPKPDIVIFLDVYHTTASQFIEKKGQRDYLYDGKQQDQYESSENLQSLVGEEYRRLANTRNWIRIIVCDENHKPRPLADIQLEIQKKLLDL